MYCFQVKELLLAYKAERSLILSHLHESESKLQMLVNDTTLAAGSFENLEKERDHYKSMAEKLKLEEVSGSRPRLYLYIIGVNS